MIPADDVFAIMDLTGKIRTLSLLLNLALRERQSEDRIRKYQQKRLRATLRHAQRFPYYREILRDNDVDPAKCTLEDLPKLPILTKEIFRHQFHEQTAYNDVTLLRTTGSTGIPLTIPVNKREVALTNAFIRYAFFKSGLRVTESLCFILVASENLTDRTLFQKLGIGRHKTINLNNSVSENIDQLIRLRPNAICSYPSYLTLLAKTIEEQQRELPTLRIIFTHGEVLTPATRQLLRTAFRAQVFDSYGSVEFGRLAYECQYNRYHIIPDAAVIEVIDKDKNRVGDCLVTSLYHETVPLIRYQIGDRIKLSGSSCRCGVQFQTIDHVEGRCDDFLRLPSGTRISARAINVLEDVPGLVEFQTTQKYAGLFEVKVRKNSQFTPTSANLIRQRIRDGCLGENIRVDIVYVDSINRSRTGKLRAVISEVA